MMNVIKATDAAVNAIRKMDTISRSFTKQPSRKQSSFMAEGNNKYNGPFRVYWKNESYIYIEAAAEFMGGKTGYAGSILAPDMQVIKHVSSAGFTVTGGQENSLLVLRVRWEEEDGDVDAGFQLVPDPWKTCSDENKMITIDHINPKTDEHPYRDPFLAIYPIARIEGKKIAQIQQGHVIDYNRWWRS